MWGAVILLQIGCDAAPPVPPAPTPPTPVSWVVYRQTWTRDVDLRREEGSQLLRRDLPADATFSGGLQEFGRWWIPAGQAGQADRSVPKRSGRLFIDGRPIDCALQEGDLPEVMRCRSEEPDLPLPPRGRFRLWTRPDLGLPGDFLRWETVEGDLDCTYQVLSLGPPVVVELHARFSPLHTSHSRAVLDRRVVGGLRRIVEMRESPQERNVTTFEAVDWAPRFGD